MATITNREVRVQFDKKEVLIINHMNEIMAKGIQRNNNYEIIESISQANVGTNRLWHERFDHLSV